MNNQFESNYALLVRSEEKGRGVLETVLYIAFVLSAVLLIWQFAQSPVNPRAVGLEHGAVVEAATVQTTPQG
jgi:ABC-type sugar transport system permease subunit